MRILALTALYPPLHLGGYDIRCSEVLDNLKRRGHQIRVLTTTYGLNHRQIEKGGNVWRILHLDPSENLLQRIFTDIMDLRSIKQQIVKFQPDVIHLFHTTQLSHSIFPFLADQQIPIIYDEGGVGLISAWNKHGRWINFCQGASSTSLKKRLKLIFCKVVSFLSGGILPINWSWPNNMNIYYNSNYSLERHRKSGVPVDSAKVIYPGINLDHFVFRNHKKLNGTIRIILPGRIHPEKNLDDALDALAILNKKFSEYKFNLKFIGPIQDRVYQKFLKAKIYQLGLSQLVQFIDLIPHDKVGEVYQSADICLLLTRIPESFSRVPLEAMACGAVMITTCTGGGAEIIRDGENGFAVPLDSPNVLSEIIGKLIDNLDLFQDIIKNARKEVERNFTLDKSVDQIEQLLLSALQPIK